jgi:nicotinamide-nucleotide amidase
MSLSAEIIAVGTELTNGAKLDTNSQWISRELEDLGHPVGFHTTVADSLEDQVTTLLRALDRSDLVIMTGGLGPTLDDLARDAIAAAIGEELELDSSSLAAIEAFFASRGRAMPERNRIQAMFPRGTVALANPIGTAPGIWYVHARPDKGPCYLASLPGVPSEMRLMFREQVCPRLPRSSLLIRKQVWNCFGLGESDVEQRLGDLTARGRTPEVGITAHEATISLRIVARGLSEDDCRTQIGGASSIIHSALGDRVFGSDQVELEDVVLEQLAKRNWSLVTLECGSSSYLPSRMLRAAASSSAAAGRFIGGYSFDSIEAATMQWTRLQPMLSASAGLQELACACRELTGGDVCLAVAYPPIAETTARNAGDVVAVGPDFSIVQRPALLGSPDIQHSRLAKISVDLLRRQLMAT